MPKSETKRHAGPRGKKWSMPRGSTSTQANPNPNGCYLDAIWRIHPNQGDLANRIAQKLQKEKNWVKKRKMEREASKEASPLTPKFLYSSHNFPTNLIIEACVANTTSVCTFFLSCRLLSSLNYKFTVVAIRGLYTFRPSKFQHQI